MRRIALEGPLHKGTGARWGADILESGIPISVSQNELEYETAVLTDDTQRRIDCYVYHSRDSTAVLNANANALSEMVRLRHDLAKVQRRLRTLEEEKNARDRVNEHEDLKRRLRPLNLLNFSDIRQARWDRADAVASAQLGGYPAPAHTPCSRAVENTWSLPVVASYHALLTILQTKKAAAGVDRNPTTHQTPSRTALSCFLDELLLDVDSSLREAIANGQHVVSGLILPLFQ
ncbi:hypothetical protein DFH07DRAFT_773499 [Mycena maculata]|uniref:Uncharacterized protein n=1 Tax=Mycena maculata TaxID=230809 RepID=A0AAD7J389_9AGAR|nr:hypothetical protein DFH07DRAFT_773499 [Mycena maculata]